eukprot:3033595-Pyramimonas_sp.AAC.1
MGADGSGMSPRLAARVRDLRDTPLDGKPGEGPRVQVSRICRKNRAAKWGWIAGSARLNQNL